MQRAGRRAKKDNMNNAKSSKNAANANQNVVNINLGDLTEKHSTTTRRVATESKESVTSKKRAAKAQAANEAAVKRAKKPELVERLKRLKQDYIQLTNSTDMRMIPPGCADVPDNLLNPRTRAQAEELADYLERCNEQIRLRRPDGVAPPPSGRPPFTPVRSRLGGVPPAMLPIGSAYQQQVAAQLARERRERLERERREREADDDQRDNRIVQPSDRPRRPVPTIIIPPVPVNRPNIAQVTMLERDRQRNPLLGNIMNIVQGFGAGLATIILQQGMANLLGRIIRSGGSAAQRVQRLMDFYNQFRQQGLDVRSFVWDATNRVYNVVIRQGANLFRYLLGNNLPAPSPQLQLTAPSEYTDAQDPSIGFQALEVVDGVTVDGVDIPPLDDDDDAGAKDAPSPPPTTDPSIATVVDPDSPATPATPDAPTTPTDQPTTAQGTGTGPKPPAVGQPLTLPIAVSVYSDPLDPREFPAGTPLSEVEAYRATFPAGQDVFIKIKPDDPIVASGAVGREYPADGRFLYDGNQVRDLSGHLAANMRALGLGPAIGAANTTEAALPPHRVIGNPHPNCYDTHPKLCSRVGNGRTALCVRADDNCAEPRESWNLRGLPIPRTKLPRQSATP